MIRISSVIIIIGLMLLTLGCQSSANQERVAVSIRLQLGDAYLAERQYQIAQYHFQKVLSVMPNHPDANLGMALISQLLGNSIQALDYYKLAMKSKPVNVNVLRRYGNFLCEQKLLNDNSVSIEDIPPDYLVCQQNFHKISKNSR
ncbi:MULTISPECIES: hypothetical protein [Proteus]|jgi:type IV pilus assembly protein PilF|uniref:Lipoprotein n=1 Tax=Proteus vulgaris TaxID=585 RepID=A0A379FBY3_PROVU|nr:MULTISPECIES: hypothetical protein [Proteus]NBN60159.1 hypothetical protein [Proteus sp. G2639]RNT32117.1 hypothetical protein B9475_002170 [Proteus mirabilis]AYY81427.1 hypothetical protein EGX81_11320 [Proteus vulgaris]KGA60642.1 tetratricopeptide repeat family protein [Proteus vulgaris]MBG5969871.1 hypothetical protein [Proteus vulgaris]